MHDAYRYFPSIPEPGNRTEWALFLAEVYRNHAPDPREERDVIDDWHRSLLETDPIAEGPVCFVAVGSIRPMQDSGYINDTINEHISRAIEAGGYRLKSSEPNTRIYSMRSPPNGIDGEYDIMFHQEATKFDITHVWWAPHAGHTGIMTELENAYRFVPCFDVTIEELQQEDASRPDVLSEAAHRRHHASKPNISAVAHS
jgi:hypothetical protein